MKKQTKVIGVAALLLVLAVVLLRLPNREEALRDHGNTTSLPDDSGALSVSPPLFKTSTPPTNPLMALMQTPIEFYGVVLDHENNPVPWAKVEASVLDNMMKGTPITTTAGADGRFTIKSKGASLHIMVSKNGYYFVDKNGVLRPSSQGFDFGLDNGRGVYQPNAASPVVFHLRKAGNPVPLDALRGQSKVPRDGSPVTIGLSKTSTVAFQISCRTKEDASQAPNTPYDWRCEIQPEGGVSRKC
jgi:hypothetical protein